MFIVILCVTDNTREHDEKSLSPRGRSNIILLWELYIIRSATEIVQLTTVNAHARSRFSFSLRVQIPGFHPI